jgi:hypothetical protein
LIFVTPLGCDSGGQRSPLGILLPYSMQFITSNPYFFRIWDILIPMSSKINTAIASSLHQMQFMHRFAAKPNTNSTNPKAFDIQYFVEVKFNFVAVQGDFL